MAQVVTEREIPAGGVLRVERGAIFTPSAHDLARERGVLIEELSAEEFKALRDPARTVALGADHGGFQRKEALKPLLAELGWTVHDVGVLDERSVDYPDIAHAAAKLVASGAVRFGILVDGAGIGSAMAANKVPGVRAALCYDRASARNSREHNDANVLTLGGRLLTLSQTEEVLRTWIETGYAGGRHQARIDKITQIERQYSK
jgi:ribose 5-phosphate isomerase B